MDIYIKPVQSHELRPVETVDCEARIEELEAKLTLFKRIQKLQSEENNLRHFIAVNCRFLNRRSEAIKDINNTRRRINLLMSAV